MKPTVVTKDFSVYIFDRNDTKLNGVIQSTCEEIISKLHIFNERTCVVSAANSLGFMDGGSDLGYMKSINNIQQLVKTGIKVNGKYSKLGRPYLNIGCSLGFFVPDLKETIFISAPTMFLPQNINGTENQYHALVSALQLAKRTNVKHLFTPMMCTGYGGYSYEDSFTLMNKAINEYNIKENNIYVKGNYIFNNVSTEIQKDILQKQPKIYMNTEFGISIQDLLKSS